MATTRDTDGQNSAEDQGERKQGEREGEGRGDRL